MSIEQQIHDNANYGPEDIDDECPNCGGLGIVAGCFEDTCCGADCDPEDAEMCCSPSRCDWCRGKGGKSPSSEKNGDQSWP